MTPEPTVSQLDSKLRKLALLIDDLTKVVQSNECDHWNNESLKGIRERAQTMVSEN